MKLNLYALCFGIGVYSIWALPLLPPFGVAALFFACAVVLFVRKQLVFFAFLCIGLALGIFHGNKVADRQLIEHESGLDVLVEGRILHAPQDRGISQRFELAVTYFSPIESSKTYQQISQPQKLLLSWYNLNTDLAVGDNLELEVRLRRPRGLSNFGQFDYRRWLLAEGIDATGYVRDGNIVGKSDSWQSRIGLFRSETNLKIKQLGLEKQGLISALALGIQDEIQIQQWELFSQTGVIHLMVISGLHIGFAGLLGAVFGWVISRIFLVLGLLRQDRQLIAICTLAVAGFYALLAGFSLPTLRALLMLAIYILARWVYLNWSGWTVLSLAFALTAIFQPLAVLQEGFWMSFGAVAVLIISLSGRPKTNYLGSILTTQFMLLVGFGAILLVLGRSVYPVSYLANLIAVPFTGLLIVPSILLAILLFPVAPQLAEGLLVAADYALSLLLWYLQIIADLPIPEVKARDYSILFTLTLCVAALVFSAVPSIRLRVALSAVFISAMFGVKPSQDFFSMRVFDVGQGTAVLLEQPGYRLLYDTGPAFSENFNAGQDILLPELLLQSNYLDALVLSHDDSDHAGGFIPLSEELEIGQIYLGGSKYLDTPSQIETSYCSSDQAWRIGQVEYRFIYPEIENRQQLSQIQNANNQSCVLLISFADQEILLAGDIEARIERQLIDNDLGIQDVELLLVPHHGSKTSSSESFVSEFSPKIAIVSAGYGNSFGHPAEEIQARYIEEGAKIHQTAYLGAIHYFWESSEAEVQWQSKRDSYVFWWQE